jgi:glucosamine-6-phosphate deaminase
MRIVVKQTPGEADLAAAREVARLLLMRPDCVLGLSTGGTVIGLHSALVKLHREIGIPFAKAVSFNVDEYAGVPPEHPGSCRFRIFEQLLNCVDIRRENCHLPDSEAADFEEEARRYELQISQAGGIDLQILGIGMNGHIGFNEPGTPFESRAHVADISDRSLSDKAEFYRKTGFAPRQAVTLGIRSIMESRKILLVAKGEAKREIIRKALQGPVTPAVPASILQLHPDAVVVLDAAAAGHGIEGCQL